LLFSSTSRHAFEPTPFFASRQQVAAECAAQKDFGQMQWVRSLLRAAPAVIGRRLAQFAAIAAASLPVAGA
jgi:hypothetical protein